MVNRLNIFKIKIILTGFFIGMGIFAAAPSWAGHAMDSVAAQIPIQNKGRIKSMDVFARETLELIAGKQTWQGKSALEVIFGNLSDTKKFAAIPFIRLDLPALKAQLGLPESRKYFSLEEILPHMSVISTLVMSSQDKRNHDERPLLIEQKAEALYTQIMTVRQLSTGESVTVIPQAGQGAWGSPYNNTDGLSLKFRELAKKFAAGENVEFSSQVAQWKNQLQATGANIRWAGIGLENLYYKIKPFHWAWILYLISFITLMWFAKGHASELTGIVTIVAGFLFHTIGVILRVLILERPPVSNMFESMIFMNWVLMVCALAFFMMRKKYFVLTVGSLVSALVMIFADLLPIDQGLDVLAPVLRSNYWLTIHVMTIVTSYGIFGFAMGLGHRHLFIDTFGKWSEDERSNSAHIIYRLIQIGLITLGAGTILGGVWANESWGRFWGWDPKETWALITFLGYMVIIHLKVANKLSDFLLAVFSIVGFLLVLMTWYGVNFLLGRGLHSYGNGSGGAIWVIAYLIFEFAFLSFIFLKKLFIGPVTIRRE